MGMEIEHAQVQAVVCIGVLILDVPCIHPTELVWVGYDLAMPNHWHVG